MLAVLVFAPRKSKRRANFKTIGFVLLVTRFLVRQKRIDTFISIFFEKAAKHLAETLTIGFLAGVAATIGMFRLIKK